MYRLCTDVACKWFRDKAAQTMRFTSCIRKIVADPSQPKDKTTACEDIQRLHEQLGTPLLQYLLDLQVKDLVGTDILSADRLTTDQKSGLATLVSFSRTLDSDDAGFVQASWRAALSRWKPNASASAGNFIRSTSGGTKAEAPDLLSEQYQLLARLALDSYPALLLPAQMPYVSKVWLHGNPNDTEFQRLALSDTTLGCIFSTTSRASGPMGFVARSTGSGSHVQLWSLASILIESGWRLAQSRSSKVPTPNDLVEACIEQLHSLRGGLTASGGRIRIQTGLTGILLPKERETLTLLGGQIRVADTRDTIHSEITRLDQTLSASSPGDDEVTIRYSGDVVFETTTTYYATAAPPGATPDDIDSPATTSMSRVDQKLESLELGLLISDREPRRIISQSWKVVHDPLTAGPVLSWTDVARVHGIHPIMLTPKEVDNWSTWSTQIERLRNPSIDIAVRRLLMAVRHPRIIEDVLLDAVIVWENIFGTRSQTTQNVTASLALLLSESASEYEENRRLFKHIYNIRSRVVHGSPSINDESVAKAADNALSTSIDALRALFTTHQDLLNCQNSEERGQTVRRTGKFRFT